jgi:predicted nucleic acid-binding Zn ribbon protein
LTVIPPPRFLPPLAARLPRADARRRVLAAWRGIDLEPLEQASRAPAKSSGDVLPRLLEAIGLDRRRADAEILKAWNHLLDPQIAAHAQPTGLRRGTLFVKVDSSVWLDEIVRYRRKEILDRLQHTFGRDRIARISFRLG